MAVESERSSNFHKCLSRGLELYVGNGRPFSVEAIADVTELHPNTIYEAKRSGKISYCALIELLKALPAGFANMVLAPAGLTAQKVDCFDNDTHRVHAEMAGVVAKMADMLRDGRFDHREMAELEKCFPGIIDILSQWMAARNAAPGLRAVGDGE